MAPRKHKSPLAHAESILRVLTEPILVLDRSLVAILANAAFCELLQVSPETLEGRALKELIVASDEPQLRAVLEAVVAHGGDLNHEQIACTIPPDVSKILAVSARRMQEDGPDSGLVLVELRDITAEKESTQSLERYNEALTRHGEELLRLNADLESFNRWVSHDLRTPLRFTNTILSQLMESPDEAFTDETKAKLQLILDSTHEMGRLIENLLSFVHLDRVPIRKRRVNTVRLVREALTTLQDVQEDRHLEIQVDDLPPCNADRALLRQVFLNLLSNAFAFTRSRGCAEIQVGFAQDDATTVYFVRDNGVGFQGSQAETIFSPAVRVVASSHFQGTGVGLTLVKRIIERHGGSIWAEGEPSRGATFYFHLGG
jgi:PAS domain S-box-containing protein